MDPSVLSPWPQFRSSAESKIRFTDLSCASELLRFPVLLELGINLVAGYRTLRFCFGGADDSPRFLLHPHLQSLIASRLGPAFAGLPGSMANSASILWSLSIQECFYLLWAPIVLLLSRKSILRVAFAICAGEIIFLWLYFRGRQDYFSIYHRFDALIYGALAALLFQQLVGRRWILRIAAMVSAGLTFLILWRTAPVIGFEIRNDPMFMILGLPLIGTFVASIVCLIVMDANSPRAAWLVLRSWPMRMIGVVSYTLYLIHGLVYLAQPIDPIVSDMRVFFSGSRAIRFVAVVAICGGSDTGERLGIGRDPQA